jgi:hypothetical protein
MDIANELGSNAIGLLDLPVTREPNMWNSIKCAAGSWLCVVWIAGCQTGGPGGRQLVVDVEQTYEAQRALSPLSIDGRLDEPAWEQAKPLQNFFVLRPDQPPSVPETTVRLLWDDNYLYAGFRCADDDIWSYSDLADDELWEGDVAALFVKPSSSSLTYYEFVIAPNGAMFDARYPSRGAGSADRFKNWTAGAKVATSIDGTDDQFVDNDDSYTVEVAIPLSVFEGAPQPGSGVVWSFAAFRYDYSKSYENALELMSIPTANGWGFHSYENYHSLEFVEKAQESVDAAETDGTIADTFDFDI